jgi:hypothetical protein
MQKTIRQPAAKQPKPFTVADLRRVIRGVARSVGEADGDQLTELIQADDLLHDLIVAVVGNQRKSGATWADIGAACGTTRQAAQMRFGPKLAEQEAALGAA